MKIKKIYTNLSPNIFKIKLEANIITMAVWNVMADGKLLDGVKTSAVIANRTLQS
ncbi:MAG: hypothetical protein GY754_38455 [bacterium]|nr:hypothetical protein [bacterium]